jgi:hypothetical protein
VGMNINAAFPSKYVKAAEIPEEGLAVTIDRVEMEDIGGGEMKPVIYFRKAKKGLVLNRTNSKKISSLVGSADTDQWAGQAITIFQTETEFQGDTVPCVRVRAAKAAGVQAPGAVSALGPPVVDDDDFLA